MSSVNKVILIGNLGGEVTLKTFENGGSIASFSIATSESYKDKETQEKKSVTEWHRIEVSNKLAEVCKQYLNKGDKIYIEGLLKSTEYVDQEGIKKSYSYIKAEMVKFIYLKEEKNQSA